MVGVPNDKQRETNISSQPRDSLVREFVNLQWELGQRVKAAVANQLGPSTGQLSEAVGSVTPHQREALMTLFKEGPLPMGELARRLLITPSSATELVDRLVERQLVERSPDRSDRRTVVIQLNPAAQRLAEEVRQKVQIGISGLLEVLDDSELSSLVELLRKLASSLEGPAEGGGGDSSRAQGAAENP